MESSINIDVTNTDPSSNHEKYWHFIVKTVKMQYNLVMELGLLRLQGTISVNLL